MRISKLFNLKRIFALLGAGLVYSAASVAATEIEVWHTLNPVNRVEFEKIVKQFNSEQSEVKVDLKAFPDQASLQGPEAKAAAAKRKPDLVQIDDNKSPEVIANLKEITPLYELIKRYPIADINSILPQTSGFIRDSKNRLLAFPFMAEIPVMFYNTDGYKKSGLDPLKPAATWMDLQAHLLALRDKGDYDCPYATSQQVTVHLENLAPINNSLFATPNNGLDGAKGVILNFDSLYMRHMALMVSWKRSLLFTVNANTNKPDNLFAEGKCAVLTTGSGSLGQFAATKDLKFGVAPMPYYDQVTTKPGVPFVSGSALWLTSDQPAEQNKATAAFLAYLAKPVVAAAWHQRTGFMPLTDAAARAADVTFYASIPGLNRIVENMRQASGKQNRGFRLAGYSRIEPMLSGEFDAAISGQVLPVKALNTAIDDAKAVMGVDNVSSGVPGKGTSKNTKK